MVDLKNGCKTMRIKQILGVYIALQNNKVKKNFLKRD
jgi:hypothetical protein